MTIVRTRDRGTVVRCDNPKCTKTGPREQGLKTDDAVEREEFIGQIGWLTRIFKLLRGSKLRGSKLRQKHFCPFCAADMGHPEGLKQLKKIFHGGKRR